MTTPVPSVRRAKKSGACLRSPCSPSQKSQNGWAENPMISGSKSSSIATSRSTHDSYPTCSPVVADHHSPGKFFWPLKDGNDLDGFARSNGTSQHADRGSRRWVPVSSMNTTSNEGAVAAMARPGEPPIVPHQEIRTKRSDDMGPVSELLSCQPKHEASNDPSFTSNQQNSSDRTYCCPMPDQVGDPGVRRATSGPTSVRQRTSWANFSETARGLQRPCGPTSVRQTSGWGQLQLDAGQVH